MTRRLGKTLVLTAIVALAGGMLAASASAGQPNPKKCVLGNARACAEQSAIIAVRKVMAARTGHPYTGHGDIQWDSNLTCTTTSAKLLVWHCSWTAGTAGTAIVTFKGTRTGWHTYVTVKSVA